MIPEQKYFLRQHVTSRWNRSPNWVAATVDDISFDEEDNSINSITTDFSTLNDPWILISSSNYESENQGMFKIKEVQGQHKILMDEKFWTMMTEEAGPFITIIPLICPIKFDGASFAYPKDYRDFFVEYFLYPGYKSAASGINGRMNTVRMRSEGWVKFLFHIPVGSGSDFINRNMKRLSSMFRTGNIGCNIRVCHQDEQVGYKDDQKEYFINSLVVEFKADYDERDLLNEELIYNVQGFNMNYLRVDQDNSFVKFEAVHLDPDSGNYLRTPMNDSNRATQIVIDADEDHFIMQNNGPVKFIAAHGLPIGKTAYLAAGVDDDHYNITFTKPETGKIQRLFEVVDPFQISIAIGELFII